MLAQANSNYLACISIEAAELSNRTNAIMRKISTLAMVFVPYTIVAALFGMNVRVPWQDVDSTWPFWGIVIGFSIICVIMVGVILRSENKHPLGGKF